MFYFSKFYIYQPEVMTIIYNIDFCQVMQVIVFMPLLVYFQHFGVYDKKRVPEIVNKQGLCKGAIGCGVWKSD